jgi:predicted permease
MSRFDGVRRAFRLGSARGELREELAHHFESTVEELLAAGRSREEAEAEARRRFGDERRWRREIERQDRAAAARRGWAEGWERAVWILRLALRRMGREPGFAAAVVLTFALGIGANATMFGIVDRLLLRPPAHVQDPATVRRITLSRTNPNSGEQQIQEVLTYPSFEDLSRARSFSAVAGYTTRELTLGRGDAAERAKATLTTANFLPLLGTRAEIGRFYTPEEDRAGAPQVVVLSHEYWRTRFGGDRGVLGRTVDFGYGPYTVIGVAPEGFTGVELDRVDLWLPLRAQVGKVGPPQGCVDSRGCWWMSAVARLAPGASPVTAQAEATTLFEQGMASNADVAGRSAGARPDRSEVIASPVIAARGPNASSESVVAKWLAGISLIVLLIACANVANLLLARSIRQRREIGVRLALGSSRAQVMAQVLAESLILALLGGVAALALAQWGGAVVRRVLLPDIAWGAGMVDPRVLWFVLALTLLTGLVAGLIPAVQVSRPAVYEVLRNGTRNASSPLSRTRDALTVLQAALSVVLLVGAGLFVRSLRGVEAIDLGVKPEGVLMVETVWQRDTPEADRYRYSLAAAERLGEHPGVAAAATSATMPFRSLWGADLRVPGLDSLPRLPGGGPYINAVTADYFRVFGIKVRRGRGFTTADAKGAAPVAVVNETMARALWPGEDPLGKCLRVGYGPDSPVTSAPCSRVVGVVENAHRFELVDEPQAMEYFVHVPQLPSERELETVMLRARGGDPTALIPTVRRTLMGLDPRVRDVKVTPFQELIAPSLRSWRLGATMFTIFGVLALFVAGIGLYSVLAFSVAQRTFELGIRSALGATRERLVSLVLRHAFRLVGAGILLGLLTAFLAAPRVASMLYGVPARDPATFAGVVVVLVAVALAAALLPARRATRVDPSIALRSE